MCAGLAHQHINRQQRQALHSNGAFAALHIRINYITRFKLYNARGYRGGSYLYSFRAAGILRHFLE